MTPRPLVFVSAASSDLASARKIVNESLLKIECTPVEESVSGTEYGRIPELLRRWIDPCQAVIHLVGRDNGGASLPTGQPRRSWTQYEHDYAIEQNKKLYVIVCDESFPYDEAAPQPDDKRELQEVHRETVLKCEFLWIQVTSEEELEDAVIRMKLPLDEVQAELRTRQLRQRWTAGIANVAVVLLLGGVIYGLGLVERKVDEAGERIAQAAEETEQTRKDTEQVKGDTSETKDTVEQIAADTSETKETTAEIKENTEQIKQKTKRTREHYEHAERMRQHIRDKSEVEFKAARERNAK